MTNKRSLLIVGVHQSTEAYPNTLYRVRDLREIFDASEVNEPLWSTPTGGWTGTRSPLRMLWRAFVSHARIAWTILSRPRYAVAYVPYPAPTVALLLSILPRRPRKIVMDAFISLYDTAVNDRKLWPKESLKSRVLRAIERRAFDLADLVVVDTPQNAEFYAELFRLPLEKFLALPLATNEIDYAQDPYLPIAGRCRVLFIGTLVPLHGVDTIAEAARMLVSRPDIEFRILGDGVEASKLEDAVKTTPNLTWQRRWHSAKELAEEIRRADLCLGIFGDTGKTQRVCPYKLYAYASVGRPVITGDTEWLQSAISIDGALPFFGVPVMSPRALADAIAELADAPSERMQLAEKSRYFYTSQLANTVSIFALRNRLSDMFGKGRS